MYAYSNPCPASGLPAPPPRKGVGGTRAEPLLYVYSNIGARFARGRVLNALKDTKETHISNISNNIALPVEHPEHHNFQQHKEVLFGVSEPLASHSCRDAIPVAKSGQALSAKSMGTEWHRHVPDSTTHMCIRLSETVALVKAWSARETCFANKG